MKRKVPARALTIALCLALTLAVTPLIGAIELESITISSKGETVPPNLAPTAENLYLTTYKEVAVCGDFLAVDPEGDILSFRVVTQPKKGNVTVKGASFVYTPLEGKKGKDSFTYEAIDSAGNVSPIATVNIVIEKQSTKICYSDMEGNASHFAALKLAERGVYVGQQINGQYYFSPETAVTRGEFLTMCVAIAGLDPISDIAKTGFADDNEMAPWVKPYVSTALLTGMVSGYVTPSGSVIFNASAPITQAEAAVMLNNTLGVTNVRGASFENSSMLPTWAYQAACNLSVNRIIPDISLISNRPVSRAEAAEMISGAIDILSERNTRTSLLSWAW